MPCIEEGPAISLGICRDLNGLHFAEHLIDPDKLEASFASGWPNDGFGWWHWVHWVEWIQGIRQERIDNQIPSHNPSLDNHLLAVVGAIEIADHQPQLAPSIFGLGLIGFSRGDLKPAVAVHSCGLPCIEEGPAISLGICRDLNGLQFAEHLIDPDKLKASFASGWSNDGFGLRGRIGGIGRWIHGPTTTELSDGDRHCFHQLIPSGPILVGHPQADLESLVCGSDRVLIFEADHLPIGTIAGAFPDVAEISVALRIGVQLLGRQCFTDQGITIDRKAGLACIGCGRVEQHGEGIAPTGLGGQANRVDEVRTGQLDPLSPLAQDCAGEIRFG